MIATLYKPTRGKGTKRRVARLWWLKLRLKLTDAIEYIPLGVADKQVAQNRRTDIIAERERERWRMIPARSERDAMEMLISKLVAEFTADLGARGRTGHYVDYVSFYLNRLEKECGWASLKDVTPVSFQQWRQTHKELLSAKSLNEYLATACGFLNWLVKAGRLAANPLRSVEKVDGRGKETRARRAYTPEQLAKLRDVSGEWWPLYLVACLTGLRRGELGQLTWGDLDLESANPVLTVRSAVGKNRKYTCLPVHSDAVAALQSLKPARAAAGDLVFAKGLPRSEVVNAHLAAAGIPKVDGLGRRADFHACRHTFATHLHAAGATQREAMELLRHSDSRLTDKVYADANLLPLAGALGKLRFHKSADGDSQRDSQGIVPARHPVAHAVTSNGGNGHAEKPTKTGLLSSTDLLCPGLAQTGGLEPVVGFEPTTCCLRKSFLYAPEARLFNS